MRIVFLDDLTEKQICEVDGQAPRSGEIVWLNRPGSRLPWTVKRVAWEVGLSGQDARGRAVLAPGIRALVHIRAII
jgi:hypothetical protein